MYDTVASFLSVAPVAIGSSATSANRVVTARTPDRLTRQAHAVRFVAREAAAPKVQTVAAPHFETGVAFSGTVAMSRALSESA